MTAEDDSTPRPADEQPEGLPPADENGAEEPLDNAADRDAPEVSGADSVAAEVAPEPTDEAAESEEAVSEMPDAAEAEAAEPDGDANGAAVVTPPDEAAASPKKWYIIKVTSGREESIKAAVERRVKIEGLEEFFGQIHIPVERVTEIKKVKETKNGEKVTKERRVTKEKKKYPGYIMAEVEFNDRILYLFRETSGVGDFVGAGGPGKPPPPMSDIDVKRMLGEAVPDDPKKGRGGKTVVKLDFEKGDKVRIREGAFSNMEGEVKEIAEPKEVGETPKVTVEVQIFGRPVGVELDYWQVDKI